MFDSIQVLALDADDTLWENAIYFKAAEEAFYQLMSDQGPRDVICAKLFHNEIKNLAIYGYGVKSYNLSMIETALGYFPESIPTSIMAGILNIGREMLTTPVELLDGVAEVLPFLAEKFRLVLATKGDLMDQERKLQSSGLAPFFHHIEVMSEKSPKAYQALFNKLDLRPQQFLMVGNSLKSDVLPVIKAGASAVHIPHHLTWAFEHVDDLESRQIDFLEYPSLVEFAGALGWQN